jgi:hypothetical protein
MADVFELVALALPGDTAPESLPATVRQFVAECWPGMSRGQLVARARRLALRPSLRACRASAPGEIALFGVVVLSVQNLAVASRRAACSEAPRVGDCRANHDCSSH